MATKQELQESIKKMVVVANNPKTSEAIRKTLLKSIEKAESQVKELEKAETLEKKEEELTEKQEQKVEAVKEESKKLVQSLKGKIKTAKSSGAKTKKSTPTSSKLMQKAKQLARKYRTAQKGVPTGDFDIERDAGRPAMPKGKRIAKKSGKTYYENRENRIDRKQPPKNYPKLEDGGMMAKGGYVDEFNKLKSRLPENTSINFYEENDKVWKLKIYKTEKVVDEEFTFKYLDETEAYKNASEYLENYLMRRSYADGGEMAKGGKLKEDDYVWNEIGKKLEVVKVTDDEYYLQGFMQPSPSPFSKEKVDNYLKTGQWSLKPKMASGGMMANGGWYVVSAKDGKVVSSAFKSENEAKKYMYELFEKNDDFSLAVKKMAKGGKTEPEETVYIEYFNKAKKFAKDRKEFKGQNAYSEAISWGRKNIPNFNADMVKFKMAVMAKGGYVAVGEKDGYWTIMSTPTTKEKAQKVIDMGVPRGEVGKVVTLAEAKAHKKTIGGEYLEYGGILQPMTGGVNADPRFDIYDTGAFMKKGGKVKRAIRYEDGGMNEGGEFEYLIMYRSDNPTYQNEDGFEGNPPDSMYADSAFDVLDYLRENMPDDVEVISIEEASDVYKKGGYMAKGGLTAYSDGDYDNKIGTFSSLASAKKFAEKNKSKYETITFEDEYGDNIVVSKDDTQKDIDFLFDDKMAKGGYMAKGGKIKDQYDGKTPEEVWNSLSKMQRQHFLYDHKDDIESYRGEEFGELKSMEIIKAYNSNYNELDKNIRNRFDNHVREGQYAYGGILQPMTGGVNADPRFDIYSPDFMEKGGYMADGGDTYLNLSEDERMEVKNLKGLIEETMEAIDVHEKRAEKSDDKELRSYHENKVKENKRVLADRKSRLEILRKRGMAKGGYMADGGLVKVKWSDAEYGDSARVIAENKMGLILKPYGQKFHLKFPDGTEKTYTANELEFYKEEEYASGGGIPEGYHMMPDGTIMADSAHMAMGGALEHGLKEGDEIVMVQENVLVVMNKKTGETVFVDIETGKREDASHLKDKLGLMTYFSRNKEKNDLFAKGGMIAIEKKGDQKIATVIHNGNVFFVEYYIDNPELKHIKGTNINTYFGVFDNKYSYGKSDKEYKAVTKKLINAIKTNKVVYYGEGGNLAKGGEVKVGDKVKSKSGVEGEVYDTTGMFFKLKDKFGNKNPKLYSVRDFKPSEIKSMAKGGKVKFADKVASVKKSLLERKKVPKAVQKDYGKTFSPAEAEDSAKRIVGAQTYAERIKYIAKKNKK